MCGEHHRPHNVFILERLISQPYMPSNPPEACIALSRPLRCLVSTRMRRPLTWAYITVRPGMKCDRPCRRLGWLRRPQRRQQWPVATGSARSLT